MAMNSFDVYSTVVFPILGGIIAGVIVILIEWGFRILHERSQRRRATKVISRFFAEWQDAINTSADLPEKPFRCYRIKRPNSIYQTQVLCQSGSLYYIQMVKISI